jgi:uncharacterized protein YjbI with pentapeptide repeats
MVDRKNLKEFLITKGLEPHEDLVEFWFNINKRTLNLELEKFNLSRDLINNELRWETPLGKTCKKELGKFIIDKTKKTSIIHGEKKRIINFEEFEFKHNGIGFDLIKFQSTYSHNITASTANLKSIDLSSIDFFNCTLKNVSFANSNFSNSTFSDVELINADFSSCNFSNSYLLNIKYDNLTRMHQSNFSGAKLFYIHLNDSLISGDIKIKEISYLQLITKTLGWTVFNGKHTQFTKVNTTGVSNHLNKSLIKYIEWYTNITLKIQYSKNKFDRLKVLAQVITSKYWSSITVFACTTLTTILLFSTVFMSIEKCFIIKETLTPFNFFDAIYFVVVTFTTLGYGDITPNDWIGELFVIINVFIGYLFLGIFIFLLSKKIDNS